MEPHTIGVLTMLVIICATTIAAVIRIRRLTPARNRVTSVTQTITSTSATLRTIVVHIFVGDEVGQSPPLTIRAPGGRILRVDAATWCPRMALPVNCVAEPKSTPVAPDGTIHLDPVGSDLILRAHLDIEGPDVPLVIEGPGGLLRTTDPDRALATMLSLLVVPVSTLAMVPLLLRDSPVSAARSLDAAVSIACACCAFVVLIGFAKVRRFVRALLGSPGLSTAWD